MNEIVTEDPAVVERYQAIRNLGRIFEGTFQEVAESEVEKIRKFVQKAAMVTNPPVWASYWDHLLVAPRMGRMIAETASSHQVEVSPDLVEFLLWPHDLGRMALPGGYLRNDFMTSVSLVRAGVPRSILAEASSTAELMAFAEKMDLDPSQYRWRKPLSKTQQQLAQNYFEAQTPIQRIYNLADNLGKRGHEGLFSLPTFIDYLKSQEGRYSATNKWPSVKWAIPKREMGAFLQGITVEKTVNWLRQNGVDFDQIRDQLLNYGAKFILVLRHGELDNPKSIVYNHDSVMNPADIIHLAAAGRDQMKEVGQILKQRAFQVSRILASPEIRARESAEALLAQQVGAAKVEIAAELDDVYAPGPYIEGMRMAQLEAIGGNVYERNRWGQYNHEPAESLIKRAKQVFWSVAGSLKIGETGVLVSHGDLIGWLMNTLVEDQIPTPENLRSLIYPNKGEGMVVVLDSDNALFTTYSLNPAPKTKIY